MPEPLSDAVTVTLIVATAVAELVYDTVPAGAVVSLVTVNGEGADATPVVFVDVMVFVPGAVGVTA
jgi:hypothetical protein